MDVRPLVIQHRLRLLRLLKERRTFTEDEIRVAKEVIDEALRFPMKRDYLVFCATDDPQQPIGYICFGPIPMTERRYDLYWIVVDQRFSRRGIGEKLLKFMEDFLTVREARRVYIDTSSSSAYRAARSFYEKHGYSVVCVLEDFYRRGDHKIIYMKEMHGAAAARPQVEFS